MSEVNLKVRRTLEKLYHGEDVKVPAKYKEHLEERLARLNRIKQTGVRVIFEYLGS